MAPKTVTLPDLALVRLPVATIIHVIVVIVGAVLLIVYGNLSTDYLTWAATVEGGNGLLAIGRGNDQHSKP